MDSNQQRGLRWAATAAVCIGCFSVPWKAANSVGEPIVSVLVLLASAATLSTLLTLVRQRRWPRFRRFDFFAAGMLATLTLAGNLASANAIKAISPSLLTVVQRTEVLVVAVLAWPLLGERVERRFWIGAIVAAMGLILIQDPVGLGEASVLGAVTRDAEATERRAHGMLLAMLAAVLFGCMAVFTRRVIQQIDPVLVNGLRLWIAVGFWFAVNGVPEALRHAPAEQIGFAAAAGIIGPFLGRLSMMMSARHLEARVTVLMTLAAPPITLIVAFLWLGDWPSSREALGGAVMLLGVAIPLAWPGRRRSQAGPKEA